MRYDLDRVIDVYIKKFQEIKIRGFTAMTIDSVIHLLSDIKKINGFDVPDNDFSKLEFIKPDDKNK